MNVEIKSNVDYTAIISDDCKNWIHQISTSSTRGLSTTSLQFQIEYLQPIITQYFIDNKSEIWSLSLIAHSKG